MRASRTDEQNVKNETQMASDEFDYIKILSGYYWQNLDNFALVNREKKSNCQI